MGDSAPGSTADPVSLNETQDMYYSAFCSLNTCRVMGGPIPWTALNEYSIRYSIEDDFFDEFCEVIHEIDFKYLKMMDEKQKEENEFRKNQEEMRGKRHGRRKI